MRDIGRIVEASYLRAHQLIASELRLAPWSALGTSWLLDTGDSTRRAIYFGSARLHGREFVSHPVQRILVDLSSFYDQTDFLFHGQRIHILCGVTLAHYEIGLLPLFDCPLLCQP